MKEKNFLKIFFFSELLIFKKKILVFRSNYIQNFKVFLNPNNKQILSAKRLISNAFFVNYLLKAAQPFTSTLQKLMASRAQ